MSSTTDTVDGMRAWRCLQVVFLPVLVLGLSACAAEPRETPAVAQSAEIQGGDARQQACLRLVRQIRYVCNDGLRENRSRGGSAQTRYDCLAARLEFQRTCL